MDTPGTFFITKCLQPRQPLLCSDLGIHRQRELAPTLGNATPPQTDTCGYATPMREPPPGGDAFLFALLPHKA